MNLDSLKQELLDYIAAEGFSLFRGQPGLLEGLSTVHWDTENFPDYQDFLTVAKNVGAKVIVLAHREFTNEELDDLYDQVTNSELPREEQRSIDNSLTELRDYIGSTCSLQMAFDYEGRLYGYEVMTDWFQTFLDLTDLMIAASADDNDDDGGDGAFGGYYSKN